MAISVVFAIVSLFVLFFAARLAVVALGAVALAAVVSGCEADLSAGMKTDHQVSWGLYPQIVALPPRKERGAKALLALKRAAAREEANATEAESLAKLKTSLARIKAKSEEIEIARLHAAALKAKAPVVQSAMAPNAAVAQNKDFWAQLEKLAQHRAAEHTQARKDFVADSHDFVLVCGEWVRA